MKIGLMLFGVSEVAAVTAGLLVHAAITIPVILLGLVLLWTEGRAQSVGIAGDLRSLSVSTRNYWSIDLICCWKRSLKRLPRF